jgi:replication-associated recombination protein RarA
VNGDARRALNTLEMMADMAESDDAGKRVLKAELLTTAHRLMQGGNQIVETVAFIIKARAALAGDLGQQLAIAELVNGDARRALNTLEMMADMAESDDAGKRVRTDLCRAEIKS